ncbi:hypothetical protein F4821DRAFT_15018 [Hypoxylon rubiginosum]|uniref:Uncharacterized protein n=1 Tax=Hypoxylon rubiginosum TaxID=110542 RepID=A0ACC0CNG0_9PEZI|nr:hypothetical protein F4821DRAFT_15018 [Hypoxylon rubiginosum]
MCTYYYLHYHHLAPCMRDIEYSIHYCYCANSIPVAPAPAGDVEQWAQQPCEALVYAAEYDPVEGFDYGNPCAGGGCLISQQCSSGGCRLEDLGGSWACCQCNRGGNTLRWCVQPMKKIPDALCYHAICQNCRPDHQ